MFNPTNPSAQFFDVQDHTQVATNYPSVDPGDDLQQESTSDPSPDSATTAATTSSPVGDPEAAMSPTDLRTPAS